MEPRKHISGSLYAFLKVLIGLGIVVVTVSVSVFVGTEIFRLTGRWELQVASIACVIIAFAYLASKVYRNE